MQWDKKKITMAVLFIFIMIMCCVLMYYAIVDEEFLFRVIKDYFILPLLDMGFWAVFVFLGIMVMQSILAPIPSELVLLSGAMIFGLPGGIILGIIGSLISATITYYISNKGGRIVLEAAGEKIGFIQRFVLVMDEWISKWGVWAIIVGRAVPIIMFDPVSYAAGISNIKPKPYLIATFLGSIPRSIFFSVLGTQLIGGHDPNYIRDIPAAEFSQIAGQFNIIFFTIFGILLLMLILANILSYRKEKQRKKIITISQVQIKPEQKTESNNIERPSKNKQ